MTEPMRAISKARGRVIRPHDARLAGFELATEYRAATGAYQDASAELQRLANLLRQCAGDILRAPGSVCFDAEAGDGDGEPDPSTLRRWTPRDFPGPRALQSALRRRQRALDAMQHLWGRLPAAARHHFTAPPKA